LVWNCETVVRWASSKVVGCCDCWMNTHGREA
jgi:hypothetical protein